MIDGFKPPQLPTNLVWMGFSKAIYNMQKPQHARKKNPKNPGKYIKSNQKKKSQREPPSPGPGG